MSLTIAKLSIESDKDKILDPACGSGTLLVSAYKQKLNLSGKEISQGLHQQYLEEDLTGIDIMPFSAHLAAINLALLEPLYETNYVRVAIEDSTELQPGDELQAVREQLKSAFKNAKITDWLQDKTPKKPKTTRGVVNIKVDLKRQMKLDKVDVIIMNPPFTSCDNLPLEYKKELEQRFERPKQYSECIKGKLSFQAYFLLIADKFLKDGGRIASVLPITTFVGKAFQKIDEYLLKNYTIEYIITSLGRSAFSDNTALTEILFVAKKQKPKIGHKFILVGTKKSPNVWINQDISNIENKIKYSERRGDPTEDDLCITKIFHQEELSQNSSGIIELISRFDNRFVRIKNKLTWLYDKSLLVTTFLELEKEINCEMFAYELRIKGADYYGYSALSIVGSLKRAMKNSDLLIFSQKKKDQIIFVNRKTQDVFSVPLNSVRPQLRRFSQVSKIDCSDLNEYVIARPFPKLENLFLSIYDNKKTNVYMKRIQSEWEEKVIKGSSNLIFSRKIDLSASGTKILAVYQKTPAFLAADSWGLRSLSNEDAKILSEWINSSLFLFDLMSKRTPTRGAWGRFDEHLLFKVQVPKLNLLSKTQKEKILATFETVKNEEFPSLLDQLKQKHYARRKIDRTFLELFGAEPEEIDSLLDQMYSYLYDKISELKETMRFD